MPTHPDNPASPHRAHRADLLNPDGSPRYTNALARQTSPYLLQHAHNPVDWHAWGEEAFDLARNQGKPIFLSIGYSTCYWCHVMERQCFEDPQIARQMNDLFVNIKVDREERPDVDDIYMAAVQLMTGSGGWPMSVFLTPPAPGSESENSADVPPANSDNDPGLKPFYAGTYFPPTPAHGRASFPQILDAIADAWKNRRGEVLEQAGQIAQAVRQHVAQRQPVDELSVEIIQKTANQIVAGYDATNGGFGSAPKFPTPNNLLLLQKIHRNNPNPQLALALDHTLDRMVRGGIFDQIVGGFHRYSTDEKWLVPHFEKMLYDNAQLVEVYLNAAVPDPASPNRGDPGQYHRAVRMTCDYVLREMTDSAGGFWSAQDAEVDAREGGNYVWSEAEVRAAVGDAQLAALAVRLYGLDRGPNFRDPHDPDAKPANVLFQPVRLDEFAAAEKIALEELVRDQQSINRRLLDARATRPQPATDDKILVAWNGMMIAALARAGRDLDEPRYTEAAAAAARCILDRMRTEDGGLYRAMRAGQAKIPAFLEDYAFFIHGLVELFRSDNDRRWLDAAEALTDLARKKFADDSAGGYFDTLENQSDLFVRTRSTYDGAVPSGNGQMIHDLLDLHETTNRPEYLARAIADLLALSGDMARRGPALAHSVHALLRAYELSPTLAAETDDADEIDEPDSADLPVVNIEVEPKELDLSAGVAHFRLEAVIAPGHHINAASPGDESVVPTTLELIDGQGLELKTKFPPAAQRQFPFADRKLAIYEGRLVVEATLRKTGPTNPRQRPRLVFTYQACTEQACLEPRSADLPVELAGLD